VQIDTGLDVRSECRPGQDADLHSPTLRRYHQYLWSKPLPGGTVFHLDASGPKATRYLIHDSPLGRFRLSSDAITTRMINHRRVKAIISQVPEGALPPHPGYTIGSAIVFPGNRVGGRMNLNGARGFSPKIADRFDLTLECIRLHYRGEPSPLVDVLQRYDAFFDLFGTFTGYVEFFLLDDLVDSDESVRFWLPFDGFRSSASPQDVESYVEFRRASLRFVEARNRRIREWSETNSEAPA